MTAGFFGTDGIRARFGAPPLDRPTVGAISRGLIRWLAQRTESRRPLVIVLGGDTRESTPLLARWLLGGLQQGATVADQQPPDIRWGGVLPTPAVALLTRELQADVGIVISASHNPFHDNGIKLFDANGFKLDELEEQALEAEIGRAVSERDDDASPLPLVPLPEPDQTLGARYLESLNQAFPGSLFGLSAVLDTGNGAASALAGGLFERFGASSTPLFASPDGRNINRDCGSTAPQKAADAVVKENADLGFSFDGDADRVIVVDDRGRVRDGDEILYLWAKQLRQQGGLNPPSIVATSMSNLGLERALAKEGVAVERCDVGDRAVVAMLRQKSLRFGGEQSGHIVDLERSTTGDGLLTALAIATIVVEQGRPLSKLLEGFHRFPQRLENVAVVSKTPFDQIPAVAETAREVEAELGTKGRLVLRYSGTESLARVMVEAEDQETVDRFTERLSAVISTTLG